MSTLTNQLTILLLFVNALSGCTTRKEKTLFTLVPASETNITFVNKIEETKSLNIMSYEYMYNGGGVAAGDFNNDGLTDLFFTGNQVGNKLYMNSGNWKFTDVTKAAGAGGTSGWSTGVTVADVNADGLLDIYVCYSGPGSDLQRANELLINNGGAIPKFTNQARQYNLDAQGTFSTQAAFFDYDLDGDLDMFLLNHAKITYNPYFNTRTLRNKRHPQFGNRLYRNDSGMFKDVSEHAGIHGSGINFGLGVSISDLNNDGWPDIYVTNDYEEQDFFYLNQGDGSFRECLKEGFRHISRFGMGTDIADFNNDGLLDVYVVDMLPEENYRQKLLKGADEFDKYMLLRDSGYHHQNMRNMLQVNLGNSAGGVPRFSEIGQMAGVASTDWSWCPLFVDLDNDGWKDLFVTNGYLRDYTNLDFLKYTFEDFKKSSAKKETAMDTIALVQSMPSTSLGNYSFKNARNLSFTNATSAWGVDETAVSNGAVYTDLDNDGDQDLVINNLNSEAMLYRNESLPGDGKHFLKIALSAPQSNTQAVGARVYVKTDSILQLQENYATRGFQSSISQPLIFGTGHHEVIREIVVRWPDRTFSKMRNISADTLISLHYGDFKYDSIERPDDKSALFSETTAANNLVFRHQESNFIDYKYEYLLPWQLSSNGPCLAKGDVNNDGFDDFYVGGGAGQHGDLFLSLRDNTFRRVSSGPWMRDAISEDTDAEFLDVDNDNDLDLYVVSGSSEFMGERGDALQDRLYINNGRNVFVKAEASLPKEKSNGSCIASADFDKDGDLDLFIGGKSLPGFFPLPSYSILLRNDFKNGEVRFSDVTPTALKKPGMINDCLWMDKDNDSWPDLLLAGDFTPIMIANNAHGSIGSPESMVQNSFGLWSALASADLDNDGDLDLVAGNAGLNTVFRAAPKEPLTIHFRDYNDDGKLDPILSYFINGKSCVYPSRDELLDQLPSLRKKFIRYSMYANASLSDILTPDQLTKSKTLRCETLQSSTFINEGQMNFRMVPLPPEAQVSRVNGFVVGDYNSDNFPDILLAGNYYPYRVQIGRSDAGSGLLLFGGPSGYTPMEYKQTGFYADGDVRSMQRLTLPGGEYVLTGNNNDNLKLYKVNFNKNTQ